MGLSTQRICFKDSEGQADWYGIECSEGDELAQFLMGPVVSRLKDTEASDRFETDLRNLASTDFQVESLRQILEAEIPEERDWAIGESIAEACLEHDHGVQWPWNHARDKRNPFASLPGADLVGFITENGETSLVLGEVKTSTDSRTPPNVMCGRSGMVHQLDNLVSDLGNLAQLLFWLHSRCMQSAHEEVFKRCMLRLLSTGNKAISLFGVLIRDTQPNALDFNSRARVLAKAIDAPTRCTLIAIYLPFKISDLPSKLGEAA